MRSRSLSPTEARVVLSLEAERADEVALADIRRRARASPGFARKLAHSLVRKGWLQRLGGGRYLLNPSQHGPEAVPDTDPLRFGRHLVAPYYFGFATAAELRGLLPQASRTYYLVSPRRSSARWHHAAEFRLVRTAPGHFFGFEPLQRRGETLVVSDTERTVLDCLARPEFAGGLPGVVRILESAGGRLDWARLDRYLIRLGSRSLARRLGFLAEALDVGGAPRAWRQAHRATEDEPYVPLGAPRQFGRRGTRDRRWRIIGNVPEELLRAEVDLR